jgi:RNA polymerase sigma-70 factor (ECF subfamily)
LQEVFRAAFSNISKFQHDRAGNTFRGWLRTIARNKIRDDFRRRGGQAEAAGGTAAYERFQEVSAEETGTSAMHELGGLFRVALKSIQGEFEERTWQAFRQVTMDENDVADVADRLEMSPAAVRQAKYRVLRRLRQELGDRPE